jgi:hypothetical protein
MRKVDIKIIYYRVVRRGAEELPMKIVWNPRKVRTEIVI